MSPNQWETFTRDGEQALLVSHAATDSYKTHQPFEINNLELTFGPKTTFKNKQQSDFYAKQ